MSNLRASLRPLLRVLCAFLALAAAASAEVPASIADEAPQSARVSFESFAESWMAKLARVESQNRAKEGASYRGFGTSFRTKLRTTGNPASPYVGLLQYTEHLYQCDGAAAGCRIASSVPVTEIFRFRDGRWVY